MYLDVANDGTNPSALAYGVGNTVLSYHSLYLFKEISMKEICKSTWGSATLRSKYVSLSKKNS